MLRLSANELSELLSNLDINFNILIYILFFILFSIIRIRRKIKNEEAKASNISVNFSQEIFSVVTETFLIQSFIQIVIKFIFIAIAAKFNPYLENKEILLIVLSLVYLVFIVITKDFVSDVQYVWEEIIKKNHQLSSSQNPDISKKLKTEDREEVIEDISEEKPPQ